VGSDSLGADRQESQPYAAGCTLSWANNCLGGECCCLGFSEGCRHFASWEGWCTGRRTSLTLPLLLASPPEGQAGEDEHLIPNVILWFIAY